MVNVVAATFGALAKDTIMQAALKAAEAGQLDAAQLQLVQQVCEGIAQPPADLLPWLESLLPGITLQISDHINATAAQLQAELDRQVS